MIFQRYDQHTSLLLPPSLEELIPEKDLVRVVNDFIDQVDTSLLEKPFAEGGRPAFHPVMMMKVLVYAYASGIYSSRRIARSLRSDVHFMWLAAYQRPDFRTINRFRGVYFKDILEDVFAQIIFLLLENGYIQGKDYFLDGTKFEADAGRYSHVWRKNTERYKACVQERAAAILKEAGELNQSEDQELGDLDLPETGASAALTSDEVKKAADELNKKAIKLEKTAAEHPVKGTAEAHKRQGEKLARAGKKLSKEADKLANYEAQEELLADRNSYSKTDTDATFLRMKNDELRAGYNVQAGTDNGFVCGFSVHPNANDGVTFPGHFQRREELKLPTPQTVIADSAYGSEENYEQLAAQGIEAYLKYPGIHNDLTDKPSPFTYDAESDTVRCSQGRTLHFDHEETRDNTNGYTRTSRVYQSADCTGCPLHDKCANGGQRSFSRSPLLEEHKAAARDRLSSEQGIDYRRRRGNAIESTFGDIKHNMNYRRIRLRSKAKVVVEMSLLFISQNLRKVNLLTAAKSVTA